MAAEGKNKAARKLEKSYFDVLGLCCSSEVPLIENILKALDGVKEVTVVVASRTVIVVHDSLVISQAQIGNIPKFLLLSLHACPNFVILFVTVVLCSSDDY